MVQGTLMIPGSYHLIHLCLLHLITQLLQALIVGILSQKPVDV